MKKIFLILVLLFNTCGGSEVVQDTTTTLQDTTTTLQDTTTTLQDTTTTLDEVTTISVDEEYTIYFEYPARNAYPNCRSNPSSPECYVLTLCKEVNDTLIKADWEHVGEPSAELSDDGTGFGVSDVIRFQPRDGKNARSSQYKNWGGAKFTIPHISDEVWNQYTEDELGFLRFAITCNHIETTVTKGGGGVAVKEKRCDDTEFWSNIEYEFDYDESSFVLDLKGYKTEDYGIRFLRLILRPLNFDWKLGSQGNVEPLTTQNNILIMDGFDAYNHRIINLPIKENKSSTNIDIFRAGTVGWLYPNERAARRPRDSMDIEATLQVWCTSDTVKEYNGKTFVIDKYKLKKYVTKQPYFVENIFEPYDINNFDETTISKDEYDKSIKEFEALKKRNSEIPPPTEVALVLAGKNAQRNSNPNDLLNEWIPSFDGIEGPKARNAKTVVGLYGNVKESDLRVLSNVFKALHVIAPGLDISYSSKTSEVTLPIHITGCTDAIDIAGNICASWANGLYMPEDYIWVDATFSGVFRERTLVHELGHALGLGHNTCIEGSVMSYRYSTAPSLLFGYFSHLDLMMLSLLYNPLLSEKGNHTVTKDFGFEQRNVTTNKVIELFNLSEDKYNENVEDISDACRTKPVEYDFLIEIQKDGTD